MNNITRIRICSKWGNGRPISVNPLYEQYYTTTASQDNFELYVGGAVNPLYEQYYTFFRNYLLYHHSHNALIHYMNNITHAWDTYDLKTDTLR